MKINKQVDVPIVLAGRYKIKPEKRERFLELAQAVVESTRQESGNISYSFYEEVGVTNSFIYFEEWQSKEALAEHLHQPYIIPLLKEFPEMVDGEIDVKIYDIEAITYGL